MSDDKKKLITDYQKEISWNLNSLLDTYSMSMYELSRKIKVSYGSIYDLSVGTSNPTFAVLHKISSYFDLSVSQFIGDLPVTTNTNPNFIKLVPVIEWSEVFTFLTDSDYSSNKISHSKLISISSKNQFNEKTFALIANEKTEPTFNKGTFLIFDKLIAELEKYDNRFMLVESPISFLSIKKLLVEGKHIFLQSLNNNVPLQSLDDNSNVIACLIQAKLELDNII